MKKMTEFEKKEYLGVPVWYKTMPESKAASVRFINFCGSADDKETGLSGAAHFCEHWPGRGTESYPNGARDTKGPIANCGGSSNAATSQVRTQFWATVPARTFAQAIHITGSHLVEPLLRDKDFQLERAVILQELTQSLSDMKRWGWYHLQQVVTPGHPLAQPILGSKESLLAMTPSSLRQAYESMYARCRLCIVGAGPQSPDWFCEQVVPSIEQMPSRQISPRTRAADYGEWSMTTEPSQLEFPFKASVINLVWLMPTGGLEQNLIWGLLADIFGAGGISSPLLLNLREQKGLVYSGKFLTLTNREFTRLNLQVKTEQGNLREVVEGCWQVLGDPRVMTKERFKIAKDMKRGDIELRKVFPEDECNRAVNEITRWGQPIRVDDLLATLEQITFGQVQAAHRQLMSRACKEVIFAGRGC